MSTGSWRERWRTVRARHAWVRWGVDLLLFLLVAAAVMTWQIGRAHV